MPAWRYTMQARYHTVAQRSQGPARTPGPPSSRSSLSYMVSVSSGFISEHEQQGNALSAHTTD